MTKNRPYHKVLGRVRHVGYIAPNLHQEELWSVYSLERKRIAVVMPDGDAFQVMLTGGKDTREPTAADSLEDALAAVFRLKSPPTLDPPL